MKFAGVREGAGKVGEEGTARTANGTNASARYIPVVNVALRSSRSKNETILAETDRFFSNSYHHQAYEHPQGN